MEVVKNTEFNALASAEQLERVITVPSSKILLDENRDETKVTENVKVYVRPFVFRDWMRVTKHLNLILAALPAGVDLNLQDPAAMGIYLLHVIGEAEADVLGIFCIATRKPIEFFDTIELDSAIELGKAIFEVNKDFFIRSILPMLKALAPEIAAKVESAVGPTQ